MLKKREKNIFKDRKTRENTKLTYILTKNKREGRPELFQNFLTPFLQL